MAANIGIDPNHAQGLLSLVKSATIPVQAYRLLEFAHKRPSSRNLLRVVGASALYEYEGEPLTYLPVQGLLKALDLATYRSRNHADQDALPDAATLIGIAYNGSLPQYNAGEWDTPQEMSEAIRTAGTPNEAQGARLALESFIGLATLTCAVALGDGELPDDDEETVPKIQQALANGGLYENPAQCSGFRVQKLIEAEGLLRSAPTMSLPISH